MLYQRLGAKLTAMEPFLSERVTTAPSSRLPIVRAGIYIRSDLGGNDGAEGFANMTRE